jgi:Mn2+/Fe2+ NRAMP family transporter
VTSGRNQDHSNGTADQPGLAPLAKPPAKKSHSILVFFKRLGPGLISGAADDDPTGTATYAQVRRSYRQCLALDQLLTIPMMVAVQ